MPLSLSWFNNLPLTTSFYNIPLSISIVLQYFLEKCLYRHKINNRFIPSEISKNNDVVLCSLVTQHNSLFISFKFLHYYYFIRYNLCVICYIVKRREYIEYFFAAVFDVNHLPCVTQNIFIVLSFV
jgi:hypothetical protein